MPKIAQVRRTIKTTIDTYLRIKDKDHTPEFKGICTALLDLCYNKESLVSSILNEDYKGRSDIPSNIKVFKKLLLTHLADDMKTANVFVDDECDVDEAEVGALAEQAQVFLPTLGDEVVSTKESTMCDSPLSVVDLTTAASVSTVTKEAGQPQKSGGWFMNVLWSVVTLGFSGGSSGDSDVKEGNPWEGCSQHTQHVLKMMEGEVFVTGAHTPSEDA